MLINALIFLLQAVFGIFTFAFLLRFYFQLTQVSFQQPIAQALMQLTNFAVKPARKVIPSIGKLDLSTLILAFITQLVLIIATVWLQGFPILIAGNHIWPIFLGLALLAIISTSLTIFMVAMLIQAVLSWINPYTPVAPLLAQLTSPILQFLRRYIPSAGMIDLSPLVFIITAQLLLTTILLPLENNLRSML